MFNYFEVVVDLSSMSTRTPEVLLTSTRHLGKSTHPGSDFMLIISPLTLPQNLGKHI